jgi:hypothetical protein
MHYPRPPRRPQARRVRPAGLRTRTLAAPASTVPSGMLIVMLAVGTLASAAAVVDLPAALSTWLGVQYPGLLASVCC